MPAPVPCLLDRKQGWVLAVAGQEPGPGLGRGVCRALVLGAAQNGRAGKFGVWVRGGAGRARWRLVPLRAHWLAALPPGTPGVPATTRPTGALTSVYECHL